MRGGYQIVNFKNHTFTSGGSANFEGIFIAVSNQYKKATLVSGLTVGNVEYPDFYAPFMNDSGNMVASAVISGDTITISVKDNDDVTVTVA